MAMRAAEEHLKRSGRRMAALIERVGPCGLTFSPPTFESLARSIVYQQISIRAARSIYLRLLAECSVEEVLSAESLVAASLSGYAPAGCPPRRHLTFATWRSLRWNNGSILRDCRNSLMKK